MHDNTWTGLNPGTIAKPNSYRSNSSRSKSVYLNADGASPWDINSDANGNPVPLGQLGAHILNRNCYWGHSERGSRATWRILTLIGLGSVGRLQR